LGGAGLQLAFSEQSATTNARRSTRLELIPRTPAYLRVVAEPWATVFVDGQKIDTTPIARPIPLEAGVHYVRLEHPEAPAELRTVQLAAAETLLLDVKMKVPSVVIPAPITSSQPSPKSTAGGTAQEPSEGRRSHPQPSGALLRTTDGPPAPAEALEPASRADAGP
jgi:hypothetical protein